MSITFPSQYNSPIGSQAAPQGIRSQVKQDVEALSGDLQSNNLAGAQAAYGELQKLLQSNGSISSASASASTGTGATSAIQTDFQALGQALSSGNLSTAQQEFSQLQTDATQAVSSQGGTGQTSGQPHHHHHHASVSASDTDGDSDGSTASSASSTTAPSPSSSLSAQVLAFELLNLGNSSSTASSNSSTQNVNFLG